MIGPAKLPSRERGRGATVIAELTGTMAANGLLGSGANGSLFLGSYWIARHGFKQPRGLSAWLATALIFWVASTIGVEALGCFGASPLKQCWSGE